MEVAHHTRRRDVYRRRISPNGSIRPVGPAEFTAFSSVTTRLPRNFSGTVQMLTVGSRAAVEDRSVLLEPFTVFDVIMRYRLPSNVFLRRAGGVPQRQKRDGRRLAASTILLRLARGRRARRRCGGSPFRAGYTENVDGRTHVEMVKLSFVSSTNAYGCAISRGAGRLVRRRLPPGI